MGRPAEVRGEFSSAIRFFRVAHAHPVEP